MMRLPNEVMAQISALQWLDAPQIKAQFGELIPDAMKCQRADVLRMLVIYRLQENFYRLKLPERVIKTLDRSVLGDRLFHAPADDIGKAAKKLTRNYKGKDYDVFHIHVDCDLRTARERKLFVKVDENRTPTHPEAMPIIVRLGRAMRMVEMLKSGTYTSQNEVAESMAMSRSMVSRVLRTAFLSPVIVEKVVSGRLPVSRVLELAEKVNMMPLWSDQHKFLNIE